MVHIKPMLLHTVKRWEEIPLVWWMSEKYDGVRVMWDGKVLRTRGGHPINVPSWFVQGMSRFSVLDGELYLGHDRFHEVQGLAKRKQSLDQWWRPVKWLVFDLVGTDSYQSRYAQLQRWSSQWPRHVQLVSQHPLTSPDKVKTFIHQVTQVEHGEGVVVRDPQAPYEPGKRSTRILKWKPTRILSARIVGFKPGQGQYRQALGAFRVKYRQVEFHVAGRLSKAERQQYVFSATGEFQRGPASGLPKIGDRIRIQYMTLDPRSGIPREPIWIR